MAATHRVAFIVSNEGIEQAELTGPWQAVSDTGSQPELLAKEGGQVQGYNHLDKADKFDVAKTTSDEWVDEECHVDTAGRSPIISSRKPDDIPAFNQALLRALDSVNA